MSNHSSKQIAEALLAATKKADNPGGVMKEFASWLHKSGDWDKRHQIITALGDAEAKAKKLTRATVTTARKLSPDERDTLSKTLKKESSAKEVVVTWNVDESVLGGIKIEFDGTVLDATLSNNISSLATALK